MADGIGKLHLAHDYLERLATLIKGSVRRTPKPAAWYVTADGKKVPSLDQLLDVSAEWLAAIEEYTTSLAHHSETEGAVTEN